MLCEGLYLYRLIVQAFREQTNSVGNRSRDAEGQPSCFFSGALLLGRLGPARPGHGPLRRRAQSAAAQQQVLDHVHGRLGVAALPGASVLLDRECGKASSCGE